MLRLDGIKKSYKDKTIFQTITFEAKANQITLLYGASGIGKTTLLDIIAGLKSFQDGHYLWQEQNLSAVTDEVMSKFRGNTIGYIPQDFALINDYTVRENLILPTLYQTEKSDSEVASQVNKLAKRLGIEDILDKKVKHISGGQKQRVAIARALIGDKALLLADEPTANLDKENIAIVFELLLEQKLSGKTIIIATHDDRLRQLADCIYTIENHKLHLEE
ncbi:ABC transporter ATP-binding protein [Streptococcus sp. CSL10205-OR2]|uniref:ABC transporter ATP-binding protein n=1 Tax=Streptococcus sp. CSL10205-OR2 TaxID=2980558 RepID=UPI0021D9DB79|nr:ABC transporter ATP-binding protein [Streptococcus sp. CSL10205-OR2]MCU9534178.1 ABC transporter ATP-binding protein [Streptococcus sp. CSL10205-OR2]